MLVKHHHKWQIGGSARSAVCYARPHRRGTRSLRLDARGGRRGTSIPRILHHHGLVVPGDLHERHALHRLPATLPQFLQELWVECWHGSWRSLQTAIDAFRIQTGGNTTVSGVHEFANTTLVYANNTKRELGHNITMEDGGRNFHCNQTSPAPCIRYRVLLRLSNNCLCLARIHS